MEEAGRIPQYRRFSRRRPLRICRRSMPSRKPRSATPTSGVGQTDRMAAKMAQPGSTRSARSSPMQGWAASPSRPMARSASTAASASSPGRQDAVDQRAAIAGEFEGDARDRRDGAAGAQKPHAGAVDLAADAMDVLELPQLLLDGLDHRVEAGFGEAGIACASAQRHHAEGQREEADEGRVRHSPAGPRRVLVEPPPMSKTRARVPAPRSKGEQLSSVSSASSRPRDDAYIEPSLLADAGEEVAAVASATAGLGPRRR